MTFLYPIYKTWDTKQKANIFGQRKQRPVNDNSLDRSSSPLPCPLVDSFGVAKKPEHNSNHYNFSFSTLLGGAVLLSKNTKSGMERTTLELNFQDWQG